MSGPEPDKPAGSSAPADQPAGAAGEATFGATADWLHPSERRNTVTPDDETVDAAGPARHRLLSSDDETVDSAVAINTRPRTSTTQPERGRAAAIDESRSTLGLTDEHGGRYRTMDTLGQGGIGVVVRAFDGHIGREVAIKELKTAKRVIKPATRRRFVDEARITAQLEHPGIVPVYELGVRADGTVYYAMRCLRGGTLADAMEGKELDGRLRLIPRLIDVCQAIAYAHSHGVVHRDLKPANVMLGEFGETLVLDWGLAKQQSDTPTTLRGAAPAESFDSVGAMQTMQGQVLGTPAYMPPEQARGDIASIGAPADVYALGAILYQLLTGRPPYVGKDGWDVVRKVREREIKPPSRREPGTPPELEAIAMRALARDPDDRYPDARAMVADLEAFEAGGLVAAHKYSLADHALRWMRRHALAIAAVLVVAFAGAGSWWYRGQQDRQLEIENERARVKLVLAHVDRILDDARRPHAAGWYDALAYKLISLKEADVEERLVAALADPVPTVRRLAVRALGGMGSRRAVDALVKRLQPGVENDKVLVVEIINALGVIGDPRADRPVLAARKRYKQWGYVWQNTKVAYDMIPPPPIPEDKLGDANAWVNRGVALVEKKRHAESLPLYAKAIELDPKLARAWTNRGLVLRRMGRIKDAVADHTEALQVTPGFPWALMNRSVALHIQGNYELAKKDLDRLIARGDKLLGTGYRGRAFNHRIAGRFNAARADLDAAQRVQPHSTQMLTKLAERDMLVTGNLDAALATLNRSLERDSNHVFSLIHRAAIHRSRGDFDAALADLDRGVSVDPEHALLLPDRGDLQRQMGRLAAGKEDFDRAIELVHDGGAPWADRAIRFHVPQKDMPAALADLDLALSHATPVERVEFGLYRQIIALRVDPSKADLTGLEPNGERLWTDRMLQLARGAARPDDVLATVRTPEQRCLFELAVGLWQRTTGRSWTPRPSPHAYASKAVHVHIRSCALIRGLRGTTWNLIERAAALANPVTNTGSDAASTD